ncbi:MAG: hypothetical protein AVDCRST_MAG01-01-1285, partial [uncultured Rubrobacteraceae bacterium]
CPRTPDACRPSCVPHRAAAPSCSRTRTASRPWWRCRGGAPWSSACRAGAGSPCAPAPRRATGGNKPRWASWWRWAFLGPRVSCPWCRS